MSQTKYRCLHEKISQFNNQFEDPLNIIEHKKQQPFPFAKLALPIACL